MLGAISARVYIIIAVITAGSLYAVQLFDQNEFAAGFIQDQASSASSVLPNAIVQLIAGPMEWAFTSPIGAIMAGLFWPLGFLWIFLFVVMQVFAFIAPGLSNVQDSYESNP